jgi:hypothetical protein
VLAGRRVAFGYVPPPFGALLTFRGSSFPVGDQFAAMLGARAGERGP